MELKKTTDRLFTKKLLGTADQQDEQEFLRITGENPGILREFQQIGRIWEEAEHVKVFEQIETGSDWKKVASRLNRFPLNYRKIPWSVYFLRIAALVILTFGLSAGFYRLITLNKKTDTGFTTYASGEQKKDLILPDGSKVTLNTGSDLAYRKGFGMDSRDVILNGEAFFNVKHNPHLPFRVFSGESVIEVTGTSFSVSQSHGEVRVSVVSGTVMLSATDYDNRKISLQANQSARLSKNEIWVEEGIPVNELSWKTGHLIFDQTPIDSALMDIARYFRRDLSFETTPDEKITAEFQDQPLHEILGELNLVAGLKFDTTGTALIVRK